MNPDDYLKSGADSRTGKKDRNEDYLGLSTPTAEEFMSRGRVFAIADGVSNATRGDRAAQYAVRGVINDFYATPETWATPIALDRVITAQNRWLRWQREKGDDSLATTLSLLVLCGSRYCIAHVGDTRIYRLRTRSAGSKHLECLTTDHVWNHPQMSSVLTRAMGLDNSIAVDYYEGDWQAGDIFLLVCDGVWDSLKEAELLHLLYLYADTGDPEACAKKICEAALAAGSEDNVSALVVQCVATPPDNMQQRIAAGRSQTIPPPLKPGSTVDGFVVDEVLHESRETLVYRVRHPAHEGTWVLKTLTALAAQDEMRRNALYMEEWLTTRMPSRHFVEVLPLSATQRQHLYVVQRFYPGATLARRLKQHRYTNGEVVQLGIQLLRALASLHRLQVIHRDIKPENLHLGSDGVLRVLDLGVAWCASADTSQKILSYPGTPSYMAPELLRKTAGNSAVPGVQTDIYAAGVTLYHLLSKQYPYGEVEPFQYPKFGDPTPVSQYRHDVPLWLDDLLLKACARDPQHRFETAEEFLLALERGENHGIQVRRQSPLLERNPVGVWRSIAIIAVLLNFFLLYLLLVS